MQLGMKDDVTYLAGEAAEHVRRHPIQVGSAGGRPCGAYGPELDHLTTHPSTRYCHHFRPWRRLIQVQAGERNREGPLSSVPAFIHSCAGLHYRSFLLFLVNRPSIYPSLFLSSLTLFQSSSPLLLSLIVEAASSPLSPGWPSK